MTGAERIEEVIEPARGARRKIVNRRLDDGRYRRSEYEWTGCEWQLTGSRVLESLTITESLGVVEGG